MKSIVLLTYALFDRWPRYANLFLESCRSNSTVDFLVLTTCLPPARELPANVKVLNLDLRQIQALASERLGIHVNLKWPFKMVDIKPALGVIFEDVFSGYDFWGYCDVDDIFGDIRDFLSDEVLESYDVICARREFVTGHFILFRNTEELARLYSRSRDWQKICAGEKIFNFDECGWGLHHRLLRGENFADVAHEARVESFMHVLARAPEVRVHLKTICAEHTWIERKDIHLRWQRGKLLDLSADREVMYYHIHDLKREPSFYVPDWKAMPEAFLITRRGAFWIGDETLRQSLTTAVKRGFSTCGRWTAALYPSCRRRLLRFWRQRRGVRGSSSRPTASPSA